MNKVKVALGIIGVCVVMAALVIWSLQHFLEALQSIPGM